MQLGPSHIQAFTSIVAIIGAAILALICDHLKRNNEQLRELAIELNARRRGRAQTSAPGSSQSGENHPANRRGGRRAGVGHS